MTWSKIDDQEHADPRRNAAWARHRGSLGLDALARSYCGAYLTDGWVPREFVEQKVPDQHERNEILEALLTVDRIAGAPMWYAQDGGFTIDGYLDHNPSRQKVEGQRARKSKAGKAGAKARWEQP